jgi:hypothetical protein
MQHVEMINSVTGMHVIVKNTFIDGLAEEELPARSSAVRKRNTAPAISLALAQAFLNDVADSPKLCDLAMLPKDPIRSDDAEASTDAGTCSNALSDISDGSWSRRSSEDDGCKEEKISPGFVPPESAGSVHHSSGTCRPCVWFWRPSSCNKESSCEYCHLCDMGAVQRAIASRSRPKKGKGKKSTNDQLQAD